MLEDNFCYYVALYFQLCQALGGDLCREDGPGLVCPARHVGAGVQPAKQVSSNCLCVDVDIVNAFLVIKFYKCYKIMLAYICMYICM